MWAIRGDQQVQILHLLRQLPAEGLVQQGFFEVVESGEFLAVDGLQGNGCLLNFF
jgi:hypothetical protein